MNQPEVSQAVHKGVARIVADLSCLPPKGQWIDHPCCSISAPDDFVAANRDTVKLFLKLIHFATAHINADKRAAGVLAAQWTKLQEQVEIESVATVKYLGEFTDAWKKGMVVWADVIQQLGKFTHELKDLDSEEFLARSCDFTLLDEILAEVQAEAPEKEAQR